jgi:hypothetical protein
MVYRQHGSFDLRNVPSSALYVFGWRDPDRYHVTNRGYTQGPSKVPRIAKTDAGRWGDDGCVLGVDPAKDGKSDFAGMMTGYIQFFGTRDQPNKPVRTTAQVVLPASARAALIEIDLVALLPKWQQRPLR